MKCSGCDRRKGRNGYNVPREDEFFMNGSMHSKVLESIDSLKWFIEEKFICFMLPIKTFFFFHSSVLGSGSARAEPEGCTNTSLPQQPCLDGKVQWVGNVAIRNLSPPSLSGGRREPPQPHRWRIWYWGSCCWALTTSPTPLGSNWSMPYFSTASCLEWQKNRRRCRGLFPWTPLHWVEGAACKAGLDLWLWTSGQFQSCFWFV